MHEKLDAWLRDGGTIRIVPVGAFGVAVLLGIIPMWLEFGTFPTWAPRERVGTPLLVGWVMIFLSTEVARRSLARRGTRRSEVQFKDFELERADQLAGAIDRLCALLVPHPHGRLAIGHIQASLLQGIVDTLRMAANLDAAVKRNAALLVPQTRREGRRQVRYLGIVSMNRLAERRGWASFRADAQGPAQATLRDGRFRVVADTAADDVRAIFTGGTYRSILTLPVMLRCAGGRRLAVVSVDASAPDVFTEQLVKELLEQLAGPHLKLIALSLVLAGRTPTDRGYEDELDTGSRRRGRRTASAPAAAPPGPSGRLWARAVVAARRTAVARRRVSVAAAGHAVVAGGRRGVRALAA